MSLRARATAFCVCSFHRTQMRKVPHKNVVMWRKVPHKNVKDLFLLLIISIFAAYRINDSLLWKDL